MKTYKIATWLLATAVTVSSAVIAEAKDWPVETIRIVVPFSPGGQTDTLARTLAQELGKSLDQAVIVENRAGASSIIGTDYVAKAKPDGYRLLITAGAVVTAKWMYAKLPYDPDKDLEPVTQLINNAMILVANPQRPESSIADIVKEAKQSPGKLSFASIGNGSVSHMTLELLSQTAKVDLTHVPYRGSATALTDVIGGQVPFMFDNPVTSLSFIRAGKLKAIAYTGSQHNLSIPNVPTIAESGYPGFETINFFGLFAPAKTPPAILDKLNAEVVRIMQKPDVRVKFERDGSVISVGSRAAFRSFLTSESQKWQTLIKERKIRPD